MTYKLLDDVTPRKPEALPAKGKFTLLNDEFAFDPMRDMTATDRTLAGAGKAVHDTLQGLGQMVGLADRSEVAESRRLDAPLMDTTGGTVGNVAGNLGVMAPAILAGGMTIPAAAVLGGVTGLAQPSVSTKETLLNTGFGAAGGAAGQALANAVGKFFTNRAAKAAAQQTANSQKLLAARDAQKLGYVIPPTDVRGGMVNEAVSGLSGKIKTAQEASARNQMVTDELAKKALGLKAADTLNEDVLAGIRKQAGNAYGNLRGVGTISTDAQYLRALDNLAATNKGASASFPGLKDNGLSDLVQTMKQGTFEAGDAIDATIVLREMADKSFRAGDKSLGKAQKAIATELEDVMERQLLQSASPELVKKFQDARKLIAKTYSVQKALNTETGNVSAAELAKQMGRGRPLSDELEQVAKAATAFPKATQALKEAPKATSPLDWGAAITASVASGNPLPMAGIAARPAARSLLLSQPVQSWATRQLPTPSPAIPDSLIRLMMLPGGVQSGLALSEVAK